MKKKNARARCENLILFEPSCSKGSGRYDEDRHAFYTLSAFPDRDDGGDVIMSFVDSSDFPPLESRLTVDSLHGGAIFHIPLPEGEKN
jgi:hypothetical protein